jgi:hypothetical protein
MQHANLAASACVKRHACRHALSRRRSRRRCRCGARRLERRLGARRVRRVLRAVRRWARPLALAQHRRLLQHGAGRQLAACDAHLRTRGAGPRGQQARMVRVMRVDRGCVLTVQTAFVGAAESRASSTIAYRLRVAVRFARHRQRGLLAAPPRAETEGKCHTARVGAAAHLAAVFQVAERCAHRAAAKTKRPAQRLQARAACECAVAAHPVTGSSTATLDTCSGASILTMPPSCSGVRLMCFFTCRRETQSAHASARRRHQPGAAGTRCAPGCSPPR